MPNFNKDILIKNIKQLMKDRNVTQPQLANDLNICQPSISKCLTGKQSISIELVFNIAQYFGTTLDALCNDPSTGASLETEKEKASDKKEIGVYDVCNSLAIIFKSALPYTKDITYKETVYLEYIDNKGEGEGIFQRINNKENRYTSIFFPNYYENDHFSKASNRSNELIHNFDGFGNTNESNVTINAFLNQLVDLLMVFRKGSMTYESYIHTIDENLDKISKI